MVEANEITIFLGINKNLAWSQTGHYHSTKKKKKKKERKRKHGHLPDRAKSESWFWCFLSVGPWVSHFTPQFFHLKQTGLILLTLQNRYEDLKYHMLTAKHGHLLLLIVVSLCPFKQSFLKELLLTELLLTQTTSLPTALFHSHLRVSSV